jgi:hypothetical protein
MGFFPTTMGYTAASKGISFLCRRSEIKLQANNYGFSDFECFRFVPFRGNGDVFTGVKYRTGTNAEGTRKKQPLFEKKRRKNFFYAGPGALSATQPIAQHNKVFLLLFVHKKKPSPSLA